MTSNIGKGKPASQTWKSSTREHLFYCGWYWKRRLLNAQNKKEHWYNQPWTWRQDELYKSNVNHYHTHNTCPITLDCNHWIWIHDVIIPWTPLLTIFFLQGFKANNAKNLVKLLVLRMLQLTKKYFISQKIVK